MSSHRPPDSDGRDVVVGIVVTAGRAGVSTGKVVMRPMRALTRLPVFRARVHELASTGHEAEVDARRRAEQVAGDALTGEETRRLVERVVQDLVEREKIVERVVSSRQFEEALERVLTSPKVREALLSQTTTIGEELVAELRQGARRLEGRIERPAAGPYGGVGSRAVALMIDALVVAVAFLTGVAMATLLIGLAGKPPTWLEDALVGVGWFAIQIVYFAGGWWLSGTTIGMRLLALRVVGPRGERPGPVRAVIRLVGLWLSITILFLGFLPVLFDKRRRALQDFLAGTLVIDALAAPSPDAAAALQDAPATPGAGSSVSA